MSEVTTIIVTCTVIVLLVTYKLYFESRYDWKQFEENSVDPDNKKCGWIIYTDKYKDGIQKEYFYDIHLSRHLVTAHIASKNKYHREQQLRILLGLKMRD